MICWRGKRVLHDQVALIPQEISGQPDAGHAHRRCSRPERGDQPVREPTRSRSRGARLVRQYPGDVSSGRQPDRQRGAGVSSPPAWTRTAALPTGPRTSRTNTGNEVAAGSRRVIPARTSPGRTVTLPTRARFLARSRFPRCPRQIGHCEAAVSVRRRARAADSGLLTKAPSATSMAALGLRWPMRRVVISRCCAPGPLDESSITGVRKRLPPTG